MSTLFGYSTSEALSSEPSGAIFGGEHNQYRYLLWRRWMPGPHVMFVGLNPSTADETKNDPTMRRCIRFAKDWGYGGFVMTNLYAERSPDPDWIIEVLSNSDPIGPENDEYLRRAAKDAGQVIAAWGVHKACQHRQRDEAVCKLLLAQCERLYCLRLTKKTSGPEHPLYVPAATRPILYLTA